MNLYVGVMVIAAVFLIGANGRHVDNNDYEDLSETEGHTDFVSKMRDHATQRHRRRSRQMFPYDYQPPYPYQDNRRDYYNRQIDDYLAHILKALEEINSNLRKSPPPPPPPPQPIYVPYPVVYYRPDCKQNAASAGNASVTFDNRVRVEDTNQIWGQIVSESANEYEDEDDSDGSRDITLVPVEPKRPVRPAPPVEHGSSQAGLDKTTPAPVSKPGRCEGAIITCCNEKDTAIRRKCFARYNCSNTFATGRACDPAVIKRVLDHFSKAYAPNRDV